MSVKTRIRSVFCFLIVTIGLLAAYQEYNARDLRSQIVATVEERMREQKLISDLLSQTTHFRVEEASHILSLSHDDMDAREATMTAIKQDVARLTAEFAALARLPEERAGIAAFQAHWARYLDANAKLLPLSRKYDSHEAIAFLDQATELFNTISAPSYRDGTVVLDRLHRGKMAEAQNSAAEAIGRLDTARLLGAVAALCAVVVGIAMIVLFDRSVLRALLALSRNMDSLASGNADTAIEGAPRRDEIGLMARSVQIFKENALRVEALERQDRAATMERLRRMEAMAAMVKEVGHVAQAAAAGDFSARLDPGQNGDELEKLVISINSINDVIDQATNEFVGVMAAVAQGDLTRVVETPYQGRFGDLKDAVNDTANRLSTTIATIQNATREVYGSAGEIATGADDLSRRTEQQASSLEETAATTEELAASVKATAASSGNAVTLTREAKRIAETGDAIVGDAVEAMSRIETASKKISDITSVIDEIAFQTNLLALNAAVEAARAGDAGKGFAVVAAEVRSLAQRSADAAKSISGLIASSRHEVTQGAGLVREAGVVFSDIILATQKVDATVSDIAAATREQANGIEEMSQAVAHMDEMTQQNAALSEESSALAESLTRQTAALTGLAATFRTRADGGGAKRPHAPPASVGENGRLSRAA